MGKFASHRVATIRLADPLQVKVPLPELLSDFSDGVS